MKKFISILEEIKNNIFIPRSTPEEKKERLASRAYKVILDYINNGSQGSLDLRGTDIEFLPKNLKKVGGSLTLLDCKKLRYLPDNLVVEGSLDLDDCESLEGLPHGLVVGERLDIRGTKFSTLPSDLKVGGTLKFLRSSIKSIPDTFEIHTSLDLENCIFFESLPKNLEVVPGYLDLYKTKIKELPTNLRFVDGFLDLNDTPIQSLPNNLKVMGTLKLRSCKNIKTLPNGLEVFRDLVLTDTNIDELPSDLKIGSNLEIQNTPIAQKYTEEELRAMITIGGSIYS